MPIVPGLDFAKDHLSVAYRASDKPQSLEIRATINGLSAYAGGPISMLWFERAMRAGGAGGAEFAPSAGNAKHVSGPLKPGEEGANGPDYRWELKVTAISPYFVRNLVTKLGIIGMGAKTTSVAITGSLPLDDSPLSVREAQVKKWLDDPHAFMTAWPDPGFPLKTKAAAASAATIRVKLKDAVDKKLVDKFELALSMWRNAANMYPNLKLSGFGKAQASPRTTKTKSEIVSTYDEFDFLREPSQAVLINMLSYFHAKVSPIVEAEITLPDG